MNLQPLDRLDRGRLIPQTVPASKKKKDHSLAIPSNANSKPLQHKTFSPSRDVLGIQGMSGLWHSGTVHLSRKLREPRMKESAILNQNIQGRDQ
jgi:hypothetical protein